MKDELIKAIVRFNQVSDDELVSSPFFGTIKKVRELMDSLELGPAGTGGYLSWTGDLLQEAEFNLARYAEYLAYHEAQLDGTHSFAKDKYEQMLARTKQVVKSGFEMNKPKFTAGEVESEARLQCADAEDYLNTLYLQFKTLKNLVDSIQRVMLCLTHRINELQSEKRYKQ